MKSRLFIVPGVGRYSNEVMNGYRYSGYNLVKDVNDLNLSIHIPIKLDINSNFPQLERLVWWWKKN